MDTGKQSYTVLCKMTGIPIKPLCFLLIVKGCTVYMVLMLLNKYPHWLFQILHDPFNSIVMLIVVGALHLSGKQVLRKKKGSSKVLWMPDGSGRDEYLNNL